MVLNSYVLLCSNFKASFLKILQHIFCHEVRNWKAHQKLHFSLNKVALIFSGSGLKFNITLVLRFATPLFLLKKNLRLPFSQMIQNDPLIVKVLKKFDFKNNSMASLKQLKLFYQNYFSK